MFDFLRIGVFEVYNPYGPSFTELCRSFVDSVYSGKLLATLIPIEGKDALYYIEGDNGIIQAYYHFMAGSMLIHYPQVPSIHMTSAVSAPEEFINKLVQVKVECVLDLTPKDFSKPFNATPHRYMMRDHDAYALH